MDGIRGYQLWVTLPPALENAPPASLYLEASRFARHGPARVILGQWGGVGSPIPAPSSMNYLDVSLRDGEVWRYDPPAGHDVGWIAVHRGQLLAPGKVSTGELAVFEEGAGAITFRSEGETGFVLGSAARHPHDLVLGTYSVHTNAANLRSGEDRIRSIGADLRRAGKL